MVVFHDIREIPALESRTVLTLGNFDGIHLGHRYIINSCIFKAKNNKAKSVVVSYDHQNSPLYGPDKNFIYLNHEKIQILEELGVDYLLLIPFNENVKNISARNFLFDIISQKMRARWIVIGYDHHFGNNREGNIAYLKEHEKELDYEVRQIEPVVYNERIISSSRIRTEIESGDFRAANEMLGFPYHISGLVERGFGRGRITGFPTANIKIPLKKLIPAQGVYMGNADLYGKIHKCVVNIGKNPTFGNEHISVEVHVLGFNGDLYDRNLTVYFAAKIRDERKFSSVEELHDQIERDIAFATRYYD